MPDQPTYMEKVAEWKRQASELANANWPSSKIRGHLIQQGCPKSLAAKLASRSSKKRGLVMIAGGILMLVGWVLLGVLRHFLGVLPIGPLPMLLLFGGPIVICYGVLQVLFD
jgi:hypothetical protein